MGAAVTILMGLLDLLPRLVATVASMKKELTRTGEMTPEETAAVNAKWEAAFASPHWQKDEVV
jgi:hypothetical protein